MADYQLDYTPPQPWPTQEHVNGVFHAAYQLSREGGIVDGVFSYVKPRPLVGTTQTASILVIGASADPSQFATPSAVQTRVQANINAAEAARIAEDARQATIDTLDAGAFDQSGFQQIEAALDTMENAATNAEFKAAVVSFCRSLARFIIKRMKRD